MSESPREWWICDSHSNPDDYFETFISRRDPQTLSDNDDYMDMKNSPVEHVIEFKAYEELKTKLGECLKESMDRESREGSATYFARQHQLALAERNTLRSQLDQEFKCSSCGEKFFPIRTVQEIERLTAQLKTAVEAIEYASKESNDWEAYQALKEALEQIRKGAE